MLISDSTHPSCRSYTAKAAVYALLDTIAAGESKAIPVIVDDIKGGEVKLSNVRMLINKYKNETGRIFTTRLINGSLTVWRIN